MSDRRRVRLSRAIRRVLNRRRNDAMSAWIIAVVLGSDKHWPLLRRSYLLVTEHWSRRWWVKKIGEEESNMIDKWEEDSERDK